MSFLIQTWDKTPISELEKLKQFKNIFYISSSKQKFDSPEAKDQFFLQWTEYYFTHCKNDIYLATEGEKVLGYLTGCRDSLLATPLLMEKIPNYSLFEDLFIDFNCHLHINCALEARGKGVGTQLVKHFKKVLLNDSDKKHRGLHIITSPQAKNVGFYKKNGFNFCAEKEWRGKPLLFMGFRFTDLANA